jgi:hypothetical protein
MRRLLEHNIAGPPGARFATIPVRALSAASCATTPAAASGGPQYAA